MDGDGNGVSSSASGNRFLFTGREYLPELGLYDYRHRIYSPDLGRFLQTDPIRFGRTLRAGWKSSIRHRLGRHRYRVLPSRVAGRNEFADTNLYRYVRNAPAVSTDPSGLIEIPWGAIGDIGEGIGITLGWPEIGIGIGIGALGYGLYGDLTDDDEDSEECDDQWDEAREECAEELCKPNPSRDVTGGHNNIDDCARGRVDEIGRAHV